MLLLQRQKSNKLEVCKALQRRALLQPTEQKLLEDLTWRTTIGLEGEHRADHFWQDLQLNVPYRLFHDIQVTRQHFHHQMDSVFICQHFALIVELKHIGGEIFYDEAANQLWRVQGGERLALGDPFSQVNRHEDWLQHFLWEIGVDMPILSAVVVTANRAIIGQMPKHVHMFKLEGLRLKLQQWLKQYPQVISEGVLQLFSTELLKRHQPKKWQHPFGDLKLKTGALCECGRVMKYRYGVFECACGVRCRNKFQEGLADYRLLVDEWITNKEFRQFFKIEDMHVVNKILRRMQLANVGSTKSRKYFIPETIGAKK